MDIPSQAELKDVMESAHFAAQFFRTGCEQMAATEHRKLLVRRTAFNSYEESCKETLDNAAPLNPLGLNLGPLSDVFRLSNKEAHAKQMVAQHYARIAENMRVGLEQQKERAGES